MLYTANTMLQPVFVACADICCRTDSRTSTDGIEFCRRVVLFYTADFIARDKHV